MTRSVMMIITGFMAILCGAMAIMCFHSGKHIPFYIYLADCVLNCFSFVIWVGM